MTTGHHARPSSPNACLDSTAPSLDPQPRADRHWQRLSLIPSRRRSRTCELPSTQCWTCSDAPTTTPSLRVLGAALTTALWDDAPATTSSSGRRTSPVETGALHLLDHTPVHLVAQRNRARTTGLGSAVPRRAAAGSGRPRHDCPSSRRCSATPNTSPGAVAIARCETASSRSGQAAVYLGMGGAETLARNAFHDPGHLPMATTRAPIRSPAKSTMSGFMQISIRVLPDLVEAAVRSGRPERSAGRAGGVDAWWRPHPAPTGGSGFSNGRGILAAERRGPGAALSSRHRPSPRTPGPGRISPGRICCTANGCAAEATSTRRTGRTGRRP